MLKIRIQNLIAAQRTSGYSLAHYAGWTDDELQQFLAGTFTPSDEMLQRLEKQLVEEENNLPVSQGHGVPRRDEDVIESLIYRVGQDGYLTFTKALDIVGNDREKTERLLNKACEDDLLTCTRPLAFNAEFIPARYYLTNKGRNYFQRIASSELFNFPHS